MRSKCAGIKFKIDRKMIKQGAQDERRMSIHKLEQRKNLLFRPKYEKNRSKSIPTINANIRLQALKDMKEELLMQKTMQSFEFGADELEPRVLIHEYSFNDIKRQILPHPVHQLVYPDVRPKRMQPSKREPELGVDTSLSRPFFKIVSCMKYKSQFGEVWAPTEEEQMQP